jgi:hypothetical protein
MIGDEGGAAGDATLLPIRIGKDRALLNRAVTGVWLVD